CTLAEAAQYTDVCASSFPHGYPYNNPCDPEGFATCEDAGTARMTAVVRSSTYRRPPRHCDARCELCIDQGAADPAGTMCEIVGRWRSSCSRNSAISSSGEMHSS